MLYYHRRQEELKVRKRLNKVRCKSSTSHLLFSLTVQWRNLLLPTFSEAGGGRWRQLPGLAVLRPTVPQEAVSRPHQHQMGAAIKAQASVLPTCGGAWAQSEAIKFPTNPGTQSAAVGAAIGEDHEKMMQWCWSHFYSNCINLWSLYLCCVDILKEALKKKISPAAKQLITMLRDGALIYFAIIVS